MPLSSEEIQRRRALVSKLKEETISHEEAQELICLLEKEKRIIGGGRRLASVCNICILYHMSMNIQTAILNSIRVCKI
jgi:hypothetical protein